MQIKPPRYTTISGSAIVSDPEGELVDWYAVAPWLEELETLRQRVAELEAKTMAQEIDIQNLRKEYKERGERMKEMHQMLIKSGYPYRFDNCFDPETGEPL